MDFTDQEIGSFISQLSSKEPVPGGGGVSALTGALAASLVQMVCSLTVGKKKYADVETEIVEVSEKLETLKQRLLSCMEEDAIAFAPLSKAYGLPKDTEEELKVREETLSKCLFDAALPPLHICETAAELAPLIKTVAEKGSTLAVSDAGCAAALATSAIKAASLNVYVNTRLMKNRETAEELNARVGKIINEALPELEAIYENVQSRLKV